MTKRKAYVFLPLVVLMLFLLTPTIAWASSPRGIPTSGGNRNTTWVEIPLNDGFTIRGLTAIDTLGRPTGTLSDFAAAMENYAGTETIIFAVNYFYAYGGPNAYRIIGGIVSQGDVVNRSYFNWGAGFNTYNEFSLFNGRIRDNSLFDLNDNELDIVTAFNPYPHLVSNGVRLPIEPFPGVTQSWLDGRVQRAFMGQRDDGTFIVGNISGANMQEVQDVARYLGLINAVNIDGGASAGIWHNGSYITRPGRQLASVIFITNEQEQAAPEQQPTEDEEPEVVPESQPTEEPIEELSATFNGETVVFEGQPPILLMGRALVPIREVFEHIGFEVDWDDVARHGVLTRDDVEIVIIIGCYTFTKNGASYSLDVPAQIIGDRIMLPLRAVLESLGYELYWNADTMTIEITSGD